MTIDAFSAKLNIKRLPIMKNAILNDSNSQRTSNVLNNFKNNKTNQI